MNTQIKPHRKFPLAIRVIAAILIAAFFAQDIVWANPDCLQIQLRAKQDNFKPSFYSQCLLRSTDLMAISRALELLGAEYQEKVNAKFGSNEMAFAYAEVFNTAKGVLRDFDNKKILEVGPGYGIFMHTMKKFSEETGVRLELTGLEKDEAKAKYARDEGKLNVITGDITKAPEQLKNEQFDAVVVRWPYFEIWGQKYILDYIKGCYEMTRPGGVCIIDTNVHYLAARAYSLERICFDAGFDVEGKKSYTDSKFLILRKPQSGRKRIHPVLRVLISGIVSSVQRAAEKSGKKKYGMIDISEINDADSLSDYIDKLEKKSGYGQLLDATRQEKEFLKPLFDLLFKKLESDFEDSGDFVALCKQVLKNSDAYDLRARLNNEDAALFNEFRKLKRKDKDIPVGLYGLLLFYLTANPKPYFRHLYKEIMKARPITELALGRKGISFRTRGDSIVHLYPMNLLHEGPDAVYRKSLNAMVGEKEPHDVRGKPDANDLKIKRAVEIGRRHVATYRRYSSEEREALEKRIANFEKKATVLELRDMKTFLLFSEPGLNIVRPIHAGRTRSAHYLSKRLIDTLKKDDDEDMKLLWILLNFSQGVVDTYEQMMKEEGSPQDIQKKLSGLNERFFELEDTHLLPPEKLKEKLAALMEEDTLIKYKDVFVAAENEEKEVDVLMQATHNVRDRLAIEEMEFAASLLRVLLVKQSENAIMMCRHLLYRYEGLGLHSEADRAYRNLDYLVSTLQAYDYGRLPFEFQEELIFTALAFERWDEVKNELKTLLTGKGYTRNVRVAELEILKNDIITADFISKLMHALHAQKAAATPEKLPIVEDAEKFAIKLLSDYSKNGFSALKEQDIDPDYDTPPGPMPARGQYKGNKGKELKDISAGVCILTSLCAIDYRIALIAGAALVVIGVLGFIDSVAGSPDHILKAIRNTPTFEFPFNGKVFMDYKREAEFDKNSQLRVVLAKGLLETDIFNKMQALIRAVKGSDKQVEIMIPLGAVNWIYRSIVDPIKHFFNSTSWDGIYVDTLRKAGVNYRIYNPDGSLKCQGILNNSGKFQVVIRLFDSKNNFLWYVKKSHSFQVGLSGPLPAPTSIKNLPWGGEWYEFKNGEGNRRAEFTMISSAGKWVPLYNKEYGQLIVVHVDLEKGSEDAKEDFFVIRPDTSSSSLLIDKQVGKLGLAQEHIFYFLNRNSVPVPMRLAFPESVENPITAMQVIGLVKSAVGAEKIIRTDGAHVYKKSQSVWALEPDFTDADYKKAIAKPFILPAGKKYEPRVFTMHKSSASLPDFLICDPGSEDIVIIEIGRHAVLSTARKMLNGLRALKLVGPKILGARSGMPKTATFYSEEIIHGEDPVDYKIDGKQNTAMKSAVNTLIETSRFERSRIKKGYTRDFVAKAQGIVNLVEESHQYRKDAIPLPANINVRTTFRLYSDDISCFDVVLKFAKQKGGRYYLNKNGIQILAKSITLQELFGAANQRPRPALSSPGKPFLGAFQNTAIPTLGVLKQKDFNEIASVSRESLADMLAFLKTIEFATDEGIAHLLDSVFTQGPPEYVKKMKDTFFYMFILARSNSAFKELLLRSLQSSNLDLKEIKFALSDALPINSARYFDANANTAIIVLNRGFFDMDEHIYMTSPEFSSAVYHIRAERIMHELAHSNLPDMVPGDYKPSEEEQIIQSLDRPLKIVTDEIGMQDKIKKLRRVYPKAKEAMQHSGHIFDAAFRYNQQSEPSLLAKRIKVSEILYLGEDAGLTDLTVDVGMEDLPEILYILATIVRPFDASGVKVQPSGAGPATITVIDRIGNALTEYQFKAGADEYKRLIDNIKSRVDAADEIVNKHLNLTLHIAEGEGGEVKIEGESLASRYLSTISNGEDDPEELRGAKKFGPGAASKDDPAFSAVKSAYQYKAEIENIHGGQQPLTMRFSEAMRGGDLYVEGITAVRDGPGTAAIGDFNFTIRADNTLWLPTYHPIGLIGSESWIKNHNKGISQTFLQWVNDYALAHNVNKIIIETYELYDLHAFRRSFVDTVRIGGRVYDIKECEQAGIFDRVTAGRLIAYDTERGQRLGKIELEHVKGQGPSYGVLYSESEKLAVGDSICIDKCIIHLNDKPVAFIGQAADDISVVFSGAPKPLQQKEEPALLPGPTVKTARKIMPSRASRTLVERAVIAIRSMGHGEEIFDVRQDVFSFKDRILMVGDDACKFVNIYKKVKHECSKELFGDLDALLEDVLAVSNNGPVSMSKVKRWIFSLSNILKRIKINRARLKYIQNELSSYFETYESEMNVRFNTLDDVAKQLDADMSDLEKRKESAKAKKEDKLIEELIGLQWHIQAERAEVQKQLDAMVGIYRKETSKKDGDLLLIDSLISMLTTDILRLENRLRFAKGEPRAKKVSIVSILKRITAADNVYLDETRLPVLKVRGEDLSIRSALSNIVINGCQAAREKDAQKAGVKVSLRQDGNFAVIEIEDNGNGIPDDKLKFDSRTGRLTLYNLNNTTKKRGTGLGTTEAWYVLVEDMGGTIDIKTKPGEGTKFTIRLPLAPTSNIQPMGPGAANADSPEFSNNGDDILLIPAKVRMKGMEGRTCRIFVPLEYRQYLPESFHVAAEGNIQGGYVVAEDKNTMSVYSEKDYRERLKEIEGSNDYTRLQLFTTRSLAIKKLNPKGEFAIPSALLHSPAGLVNSSITLAIYLNWDPQSAAIKAMIEEMSAVFDGHKIKNKKLLSALIEPEKHPGQSKILIHMGNYFFKMLLLDYIATNYPNLDNSRLHQFINKAQAISERDAIFKKHESIYKRYIKLRPAVHYLKWNFIAALLGSLIADTGDAKNAFLIGRHFSKDYFDSFKVGRSIPVAKARKNENRPFAYRRDISKIAPIIRPFIDTSKPLQEILETELSPTNSDRIGCSASSYTNAALGDAILDFVVTTETWEKFGFKEKVIFYQNAHSNLVKGDFIGSIMMTILGKTKDELTAEDIEHGQNLFESLVAIVYKSNGGLEGNGLAKAREFVFKMFIDHAKHRQAETKPAEERSNNIAVLHKLFQEANISQASRVLISENLLISDGNTNELDEARLALKPLLGSGKVAILKPDEIRRHAINRREDKSKLAIVLSREDFENKAIWNGSEKETSLKASLIILDDRLTGANYLYIEGVIGLAYALMSNNKRAISAYYRILSGAAIDDAVLKLLDDGRDNTVAFALRAILKFKPTEKMSEEEFNSYRITIESALINA
ncbi:MAG: ATP-binding protein [Candidatus Omnitrophota bacterium]|nr:ATP-binding protein [Candidatus Omnitrophota bacterium]